MRRSFTARPRRSTVSPNSRRLEASKLQRGTDPSQHDDGVGKGLRDAHSEVPFLAASPVAGPQRHHEAKSITILEQERAGEVESVGLDATRFRKATRASPPSV